MKVRNIMWNPGGGVEKDKRHKDEMITVEIEHDETPER